MPKNWAGTQSDNTMNRQVKPQAPPCDLDVQAQLSDNVTAASFGTDNYYEATFDQWNNVIVKDDRGYHREATPGMSQPGDRQFASNREDLQGTGYGKNEGLNEIPYGQGAAFNTAEKVAVDVSRADRGKES